MSQLHLPIELWGNTVTVAGDDGLEPPNVGIKIRCLTNLANPQLNFIWHRHKESNLNPRVRSPVHYPLYDGGN